MDNREKESENSQDSSHHKPADETPKSIREIDRIIQMAWEDRTTFEAIEFQFGLSETEVIKLMRKEMKPSSFKMWRARVSGRSTKHSAKRNFEEGRFRCSRQKSISNNKISKR